MCFRPADASVDAGSNTCPECGQDIQVLTGIALKKCPHCKCDLVPYWKGEKPIPAAPPIPRASTPAAPKAPETPKA